MLLRKDISQHQNVPKEYNLDITEENVKNTFVFTEQDLPGYKTRSQTKFDLKSANMPARLIRSQQEKSESRDYSDPSKRFQPYFRKAIPSQFNQRGA